MMPLASAAAAHDAAAAELAAEKQALAQRVAEAESRLQASESSSGKLAAQQREAHTRGVKLRRLGRSYAANNPDR